MWQLHADQPNLQHQKSLVGLWLNCIPSVEITLFWHIVSFAFVSVLAIT